MKNVNFEKYCPSCRYRESKVNCKYCYPSTNLTYPSKYVPDLEVMEQDVSHSVETGQWPKINPYLSKTVVETMKHINNYIETTRKVSDSMMDINNFYVNFAGKSYKPTVAEIEQTSDEYPIVKLECEISPRNRATDYVKVVRRNVSNSLYGKYGSFANCHFYKIKNVIFNPPATIVFWEDGTKTVVKAQNDEVFDPEKGITMAIAKKLYGNKGSYFNEIKKWTEKAE